MARPFKIGLFQLSSHPAVIIAEKDYLEVPCDGIDLSPLASSSVDIRKAQGEIRRRYVEWARHRLIELLNWLSTRETLPDVVAMPECSVPWECLQAIQGFSKSLEITVIAGSHTPRRSVNGREFYRNLGADRSELRQIFNSEDEIPAVMPILSPTNLRLVPKLIPSVFEHTDVTRKHRSKIKRNPIRVAGFSPSFLPLICAEALLLNGWGNTDPEFTAIVSYDTNPARFNKRLESLIENRIPVFYVNDARWGGSCVLSAVDARGRNWWFDSPNEGRLPPGDAYLEVELDLDSPSVEVGVAEPRIPASLTALCEIYYSDEVPVFEPAAKEALAKGDQLKLLSAIEPLRTANGKSIIAYRRWSMIAELLGKENLSKAWVDCLSRHIQLTDTPRLETIEQDLIGIARASLELAQSALTESGTDSEIASVVRLNRELKTKSTIQAAPVARVGSPAIIPIGRDTDIAELRKFINSPGEQVLCLTGLASVGKSTVIASSLTQSSTKYVWLQCVAGCSADFLFEMLMQQCGRTAAGAAPRSEFPVNTIAEALSSTKVLWVEDAHHLIDFGTWRTTEIGKFFEAFLQSAVLSKTKIIIETTRSLPVDSDVKLQVRWRTLRGISTHDGVAFLDQQLNRLDLPLDSANPQQKHTLVSTLDGHPGLIVVTADLIARRPIEDLIRDLRSRKGRLNEAIRRLFSLASLPINEKTVLAALKEVRIPIPMNLVDLLMLGETSTSILLDLMRAGFVVRESASLVAISPILRVAEVDLPELDSKLRIDFHRRLTQHFTDLARSFRRDDYLSLAVEANYHASHAGLSPPCNLGGILDGLNAAVSDEYVRQNHAKVISMLSNISSAELPEDLQFMLACSFGWEGKFDEGFEIACRLSEKNLANASAFAEICKAALRSRQNDQAQRAVDYAEKYEHDSYLVDLYKGRLAELKGQVFEAVNHFEDASRKSSKDPWPYFYWARGLLRAGQPEKTLDTTSLGRDFIEDRHGISVRNFEKALMSIELSALVQTGDTQTAMNIVDTIDLSREENPETILSVGFVRASIETEGTSKVEVLAHFERAVENIKQSEKQKRFVQAKISLFRGKLFEQFGDLGKAQEEYSRAVREDAHNVHMKECLMRVSARLAKESQAAGKDSVAMNSAMHAADLAKQILRYDSGHVRAIHMQEDMYRGFGIDPK
jgi:tetratricopeptide (TPR) repeat protein